MGGAARSERAGVWAGRGAPLARVAGPRVQHPDGIVLSVMTGNDRRRGPMRTIRIAWLAMVVVLSIGCAEASAQAPAASEGWVVISVRDSRSLRGLAYPVTPTPPP